MKINKESESDVDLTNTLSSVWPFKFDSVQNWAYWDNLFTPEECKKIVEIGLKRQKIEATVSENKIKKVRKSKIVWLTPHDDLKWAYERIAAVIVNLNERFFNFDLFGITENLQFTIYESPGGKYDKHIDRNLDIPVRKLSFVLQLSDPKTYEGGTLDLWFSQQATKIKKEQGYAVLFPSYVLHGVTPVTKGTRYSLVAWVTGPAFK